MREQRAKKTTPGREDGAVREDRKRKDGVRRIAFSGQKQDGTPRAWVTKAGSSTEVFGDILCPLNVL